MKLSRLTYFIISSAVSFSLSGQITVPGSNFGYTNGAFSVTDGGAATYQIPFVIPPGTAGLQPSVGLSYSSQGGNSFVGLGWNLTGFSVISRSSKTRAQDEISDASHQTKAVELGINYSKADRFSLDGERLVLAPESIDTSLPFDANYGSDETVYYTEQNNFTKVQYFTNSSGTVSYFKAYTKSGLIFEYGLDNDSAFPNNARSIDPNKNIALQWFVNKISDRSGNYMEFFYQKNEINGEVLPARINYTGNTTESLLPYNTIEFAYETRPDAKKVYGIQFQKANNFTKRLKGVKILYQNDLIREYKLTYTFNQYSLLSQVQECDGDSPQNCFEPTTFDWSNLSQPYGSPIQIPNLPGDNDHRLFGEFNGDGLVDIAVWNRPNFSTLEVKFYINNGQGNFIYSNCAYTTSTLFRGNDQFDIKVGQFNGDDINDIVAFYANASVESGVFLLSNPNNYNCSFTINKASITDFYKYKNLIVDINRDGITDFVYYDKSTANPRLKGIKISKKIPTGTTTPDSEYYQVVESGLETSGYFTGINSSKANELIDDIDNDGLTDFLIYDKATGNNAMIFTKSVRTANINSERKVQFEARIDFGHKNLIDSDILLGDDKEVVLVDLNGDNLPEIFTLNPTDNKACVYHNKGMGTLKDNQNVKDIYSNDPQFYTCTTLPSGLVTGYPNIYPNDFNADGLIDITLYNKETGANKTFLNKGCFTFSFPPYEGPYIDLINRIPTQRLKEPDTNQPKSITGSFLKNSHADFYYSENNLHYLRSLPQSKGLSIKKVTDGTGIITNIEYDNLLNPNVYEKVFDATFPNIEINSPIYVVSKTDQGISTSKRTNTYKYGGGIVNVEGRGFRGFSKVIEKNVETGITETRTYLRSNNDWKYGGSKHIKTERVKKNGEYISISQKQPNIISYPASYPTSFHSYYQSETIADSINLKTQVVTKFLDNYGNPLKVIVDKGGGYKDSTVNTYTDNVPSWILGRLTLARVFRKAPNKPTIERRATFTYNTKGLLTTETSDANLGTQERIVKTYTYDDFGNIIQSKTSAWNGTEMEDRIVSTSYDATTKRFVVSTTNPLGHSSTTTYIQSFGVPQSQTDINGLTTTFEYDGFSRLKKQTMPDGTWATTAYRKKDAALFDSPSNAVFLTYKQSITGQIEIEHFDAFNRSIQSQNKGFDGRTIISNHTFGYYTTGANFREIVRDNYPYFDGQSSAGYSEKTIDDLGRVYKIVKSDEGGGTKIASVTYSDLRVESTNFLGQKKSTVYDTKGRVIESIDDYGKKLTYTYDAAERILTTKDSKGNTITNIYDNRGNKIEMRDPDMGTYKYAYNGFGELIEQTYPDGKKVTFTYDKLGRILTRVDDDGTTTNTYDVGNKAKGKLSRVTSYVSIHGYAYDNLGRKLRDTTKVDGKTFITGYTYDSKGRLSTLSYPSAGLVLKHEYNDFGYLYELRNNANNQLFWRAISMDAFGAITQQEFGNGVRTTTQFDAITRYLESIKSVKGITTLQDFSYTFDKLGNLLSRKDEKRNNTEEFTYDDLNRLKTTSINDQTKTQISYDELGNITYKSDVGYYDHSTAHRLTNIRFNSPDVSCSYNSKINTVYNSFNKVEQITNDTTKVTVFYGPDQQRILQRMYVRNVLTRTKIYLGITEVEIFTNKTLVTNYIGSIGVQISETKNNTSTSKIQYYLKDHLGSITGLTDEVGALVEEFSYDAWGKRRNADWKISTAVNSNSERGFTSHEHYDLFNIIDMNGRIYDPVIGRFLQPDPFIQEPLNLQSYNRYAYVMNNPLGFTDPSGYFLDDFFDFVRDPIGTITDWVEDGYDYIKDNWKPLLTTALQITATVFFGPEVGGFVGGFTGSLLNGGNLGDALKAGLRGAVIGGISAYLTNSVGTYANNFAQYSVQNLGIKIIGHGIVQGTMTEVSGGKFAHGFIVGAVTGGSEDFIADSFSGSFSQSVTASAILGGVTSELTGGSFANGAVSGAFVMMFNYYNGQGSDNEMIKDGADIVDKSSTLTEYLHAIKQPTILSKLLTRYNPLIQVGAGSSLVYKGDIMNGAGLITSTIVGVGVAGLVAISLPVTLTAGTVAVITTTAGLAAGSANQLMWDHAINKMKTIKER